MGTLSYTGEINLPSSSNGWQIAGAADFNLDGQQDLLMYNPTLGSSKISLMRQGAVLRDVILPSKPGWKPVAAADFNKDGKVDILATETKGSRNQVWYMNGTSVTRSADLTNWAGSNAVAAGDFNQDGNTDVVIYNRDSKWSGIWLMQGTQQVGWGDLSKWEGWTPVAAADVNKDKVTDIVFYNPIDKSSRLELMGTGSAPLDLPNLPNSKPVGLGDFNRDGQFDVLTNNTATGSNTARLVSPTSTSTTASTSNWVLKYREDFSSDVNFPAWNRYSGVPSTANLDSWFKPSNAVVQNGFLNLLIKPELNNGDHYAGAGIDTGFGYKQDYGKWSVRVKAPSGKGASGYVGLYAQDAQGNDLWPPEIVLTEVQGKAPTSNVMTVWTQGASGPEYNSTTYVGPNFTDSFHTFTVEYDPGQIRWYVDGNLRKTAAPSNFPANLKWKLAIGDLVGDANNSFIGAPDSATSLSTAMQVDWVEIYQKA